MTNTRFTYPKGRIIASGLFFDNDSLTKNNIIERIYSEWQHGSKVYETPHGYLLVWPTTKPIYVTQAYAIPVVLQSALYTNALLAESDLETYKDLPNVFLFIKHGQKILINLSDCHLLDPAIWLSLNSYQLQAVESLGKIPEAPKTAQKSTTENIRAIINKPHLKESDDLKETLSALKNIKGEQSGSSDKKSVGNISSFFSALKHAFKTSSTAKENTTGGASSTYSQDQTVPPGITSRIKAVFSRYLMASQLGKIIGRSQAKYLQKMMDKFDGDNLEDALKHAIPLSSLQDAFKSSQSMGRLLARKDLSINTQGASSSSSVYLDDQFLDHLKQMYERTFQKLDADGKVEEAAFVLAELLKHIDRAVQYLEKHQKLTLAAELAEGQKLPPARIIRQWIIAGNIERALHIAKIASCYQEAITALEGSHDKEAKLLRWDCALLQAKAGNYGSAADIAWPIKEHRDEIITWLNHSANEGGSIGAKHLLRLAIHDTDNSTAHFTKLNQILSQEDEISVQSKLDLIDEIIHQKASREAQLAATLMCRRYLRDVSLGLIQHQSQRWKKLIDISGDQTLQADLRNVQINEASLHRDILSNDQAIQLKVAGSNGRSAQDVATLRNGNLLVAFGESGVEYWSNTGKLLQSFFTPCHKIIISDYGNHALFIAERSGYQIVHKFTLHNRLVEYWLELSINQWASTYDGLTWAVAKNDVLWMLDVQTNTQTALWSVDKLNGEVVGIKRSPQKLSFALQGDGEFELWSYQLPNLFLKERTPYHTVTLKDFVPLDFNENGLLIGTNNEDAKKFSVFRDQNTLNWQRFEKESQIHSYMLFEDWASITSANENDESIEYHLYNIANDKLDKYRLSISFDYASHISSRKINDTLLLWHPEGRICILSLKNGSILNDFSI